MIKGLALIIVLNICFGCKKGRPARKKLPDSFFNVAGLEEEGLYPRTSTARVENNFPFYYSDTVIQVNGFHQNLVNIMLPDPTYDAVLLNTIKVWEPLENSVWSELIRQDKKGAVIDLRERDNTVAEREDISIREKGNRASNLSLVFLWDKSSKNRLTQFMQELSSIPGITYKILDNKDPGDQQDCFKPTQLTLAQ